MKTIFYTAIALCFAGIVGASVPDNPASAISPEVVAASIPDSKPATIVVPGKVVVVPEAEPSVEPDPAPFWVDYSTAYAKSSATGDPMVVVFGMEGCGPCAATKDDIESEAETGVIYCYVDVLQEPEVAQNFGYTPPNLTVPKVEILAYQEGVLVRSWKHDGRPVKSAICGAARLAAKAGKRALSVLKKAASVVVNAAPIRQSVGYFQEVQPVRNFFRGRCLRCR